MNRLVDGSVAGRRIVKLWKLLVPASSACVGVGARECVGVGARECVGVWARECVGVWARECVGV